MTSSVYPDTPGRPVFRGAGSAVTQIQPGLDASRAGEAGVGVDALDRGRTARCGRSTLIERAYRRAQNGISERSSHPTPCAKRGSPRSKYRCSSMAPTGTL